MLSIEKHTIPGGRPGRDERIPMYDKSDPRSALAPQRDNGATATPASFGRYYEDPPVVDDANGRAWYTRGQDLLVNYIETKPGATFSRAGQVDEYMIVLPDE